MRLQFLHTLAIALIAAAAAWVGLHMLVGPDGQGFVLAWSIAGSIFIWLAFGNLYLHTNAGYFTALYLGILSPFLGCILVIPPWSIVVVFSRPLCSVGLGIATSLVVCAVSKKIAD